MDKKHFQKEIDGVKKVTMSDKESQAILVRLLKQIEVNPEVKQPQRKVSPLFVWQRRFAPALAIILIFLLTGGVVSAAENTVPGDLLYPIKVKVTEPVIGKVKVSVSAKTKWEAEKAARRLEEAAKIAAKGELNAPVAKQLREQFAANVEKFDSLENELEQTDNNEAITSHNELEAQINAHAEILKEIKDQSTEDQKSEVAQFEDTVREESDRSANKRTELEKKYIENLSSQKDKKETLKTKRKSVEDEIKKAKDRLKINYEGSQGLGREMLDNASNTLNEAQNNLDRINKNADNNDADSYSSLFSAKRHSDEANITIKRESQLKKLRQELRNEQKEDRKDNLRNDSRP